MYSDSDNYERFIAMLIDNIKKSGRDIRDLGYGRKNLLTGYSGQRHQIDVSFIDYSFNEPTLIIIECKKWNKNKSVDVSVPKVLKYNSDDIIKNSAYPDHCKMIIVTSSKFNSGTKKLAGYENILIQIVNPTPPYGFSYENSVQLATADDIRVSDYVNVNIHLISIHRMAHECVPQDAFSDEQRLKL